MKFNVTLSSELPNFLLPYDSMNIIANMYLDLLRFTVHYKLIHILGFLGYQLLNRVRKNNTQQSGA